MDLSESSTDKMDTVPEIRAILKQKELSSALNVHFGQAVLAETKTVKTAIQKKQAMAQRGNC